MIFSFYRKAKIKRNCHEYDKRKSDIKILNKFKVISVNLILFSLSRFPISLLIFFYFLI